MLIFWVTGPHTGRIVTQWRYCKQSKDSRGQTYRQPLLLCSEILLFWRTSCARDFFLIIFFWYIFFVTASVLVSFYFHEGGGGDLRKYATNIIFDLCRLMHFVLLSPILRVQPEYIASTIRCLIETDFKTWTIEKQKGYVGCFIPLVVAIIYKLLALHLSCMLRSFPKFTGVFGHNLLQNFPPFCPSSTTILFPLSFSPNLFLPFSSSLFLVYLFVDQCARWLPYSVRHTQPTARPVVDEEGGWADLSLSFSFDAYHGYSDILLVVAV